jgi:hypothetical protein
VKASTGARPRCATKTSAATKSATWRTCRRRHLLPLMSTSLTRRSGATARRPPRHTGVHPRLQHRDARGRLWERYPPPGPRPRSRRRRIEEGTRPGPWCRQTPPRGVPTSKPSTLKKTRATCSRRRQRRLRRQEGKRRRCPARHLECRGTRIEHRPSG